MPLNNLIFCKEILNCFLYPKYDHHFSKHSLPHIYLALLSINNTFCCESKELKNLLNWFNVNGISFNLSKAELVMFSPPKKQLDHELKIKRNGKKLSIQLIQGNIWDFISINT